MSVARGFLYLLLLGLAGCMASPREEASQEVARLDAAIGSLKPRLEACQRDSGYQPLAESEAKLGPGEQAYRDCLYRGMEELVLPAITPEEVRGWYRDLIAEDRRLTEAVAAGRMTRGERQVRLDAAWRSAGERYRAFTEKQVTEKRIAQLEADKRRFEPNKSVLEIQDRLNVINTMFIRR